MRARCRRLEADGTRRIPRPARTRNIYSRDPGRRRGQRSPSTKVARNCSPCSGAGSRCKQQNNHVANTTADVFAHFRPWRHAPAALTFLEKTRHAMNRRDFLRSSLGCAAIGAAAGIASTSPHPSLAGEIGITTGSFMRHLSPERAEGKLRLLDLPKIMRDELGMARHCARSPTPAIGTTPCVTRASPRRFRWRHPATSRPSSSARTARTPPTTCAAVSRSAGTPGSAAAGPSSTFTPTGAKSCAKWEHSATCSGAGPASRRESNPNITS